MNLFSKLFECKDIDIKNPSPVVDDDEGANAESYIEHSDDMMAQCNCQDKLSTYAEFCKQHEDDVPLGANRQILVITNPINIATDEDGKQMPTTTNVPNSESEQTPVVDAPDEVTATDSTAAEQQSDETTKASECEENSEEAEAEAEVEAEAEAQAEAEAETEVEAEASTHAPECDGDDCGGDDYEKVEEKKSHVAAIMKEIDAVKLPEDAEFDKDAELIEEPANDDADEPKEPTQQDVVDAATQTDGDDTTPTDEPIPDPNEEPETNQPMYILATIEDGGVVRNAVFSSDNAEYKRLTQMLTGETLTTKSGYKVTKLSDPIVMDEYANKIIQ